MNLTGEGLSLHLVAVLTVPFYLLPNPEMTFFPLMAATQAHPSMQPFGGIWIPARFVQSVVQATGEAW